MMKNRRGWVAIIEMSLAIVILFSFFVLAFENPLEKNKKDYSGVAQEILYQVENNESLRTDIRDMQDIVVEQFLREDIKKFDSSVNLSVCTAEIGPLCSSPRVPENKEISAYDFFVFNKVTGQDSKKLKVFLWSEG